MAYLNNFNTEAHRGTQRENTGKEKIIKSCLLCVPPVPLILLLPSFFIL
ncbi:MAG: hypothetical protein Ta2B_15270 [Termitinemataceae bacterium]|nr:MAG: hypothetical protein Ta2B_15270 [Termitinemataceae bacterium]